MSIDQLARIAVMAGVLIHGAAFAVDGVILLDQNKAMAGNVTPGDTPGFPITISLPGSYRLDGNLTVPDRSTTAILITANHVTIDLNGFAITGPVTCEGGFTPCLGKGGGVGITNVLSDAPIGATPTNYNITIRNGTVAGFGYTGIALYGDNLLVEYLHVRDNGAGGISLSRAGTNQEAAIVHRCIVNRNAGDGIFLEGGIVSDSVSSRNALSGIYMVRGVAKNNVAAYNSTYGLLGGVFGGVSFTGNNFHDNLTGAVNDSVYNQGQNLCDGKSCPGAIL